MQTQRKTPQQTQKQNPQRSPKQQSMPYYAPPAQYSHAPPPSTHQVTAKPAPLPAQSASASLPPQPDRLLAFASMLPAYEPPSQGGFQYCYVHLQSAFRADS